MNILLILILIACIAILAVLLPTGATLVLSSRISREEELKVRKLSVKEDEKNVRKT